MPPTHCDVTAIGEVNENLFVFSAHVASLTQKADIQLAKSVFINFSYHTAQIQAGRLRDVVEKTKQPNMRLGLKNRPHGNEERNEIMIFNDSTQAFAEAVSNAIAVRSPICARTTSENKQQKNVPSRLSFEQTERLAL